MVKICSSVIPAGKPHTLIPRLPREIWIYILSIKTWTNNRNFSNQYMMFERYHDVDTMIDLYYNEKLIAERRDWRSTKLRHVKLYMTNKGLWEEHNQRYIKPMIIGSLIYPTYCDTRDIWPKRYRPPRRLFLKNISE